MFGFNYPSSFHKGFHLVYIVENANPSILIVLETSFEGAIICRLHDSCNTQYDGIS